MFDNPYLSKNFIASYIYIALLIFMILVNSALFIPYMFKIFVIQEYPFFTFTILCAIELLAMIIAALFNVRNYSFSLSISNMLLFLFTGLAMPYLLVSFLRTILIILECKKAYTTSNDLYHNYLHLNDAVLKAELAKQELIEKNEAEKDKDDVDENK